MASSIRDTGDPYKTRTDYVGCPGHHGIHTDDGRLWITCDQDTIASTRRPGDPGAADLWQRAVAKEHQLAWLHAELARLRSDG